MEKPESYLGNCFIFVRISKNLEINDYLNLQKTTRATFFKMWHTSRCGTYSIIKINLNKTSKFFNNLYFLKFDIIESNTAKWPKCEVRNV